MNLFVAQLLDHMTPTRWRNRRLNIRGGDDDSAPDAITRDPPVSQRGFSPFLFQGSVVVHVCGFFDRDALKVYHDSRPLSPMGLNLRSKPTLFRCRVKP